MTRRLRSLLLVDDEVVVLRGWKLQLGIRQLDVFVATDRATAVAHAEQHDIDLAVVDQRLGADRGVEVISAVRAIRRESSSVLTSAQLETRDVWEAGSVGAKCMQKPHDIRVLVDLIEAGKEIPMPLLTPTEASIETVLKLHIGRVLLLHGNNVTEAAKSLGMTRRGMQKRLRKEGCGDADDHAATFAAAATRSSSRPQH